MSSFGPDSKQASQATALLSCVGPHVANVFGLPSVELWSSIMWCVIGDDNACAMQDTIEALTANLKAASIPATRSGSVSISIRANGVYLASEPRSAVPIISLRDAGSSGIRVMALAEGEDPRPLYIVPIDPSVTVNDSYEKQALEERVRAALAALLGSKMEQSEFAVELDDLMQEAIEVWDIWADQDCRKYLRNAVRAYARQVFHEISKVGLQITVNQDRITFQHITPAVAADARQYLSSVAFRKGYIDLWSSAVQLDFSSLAEGW